MSTVTIDNIEYSTEAMSDEALANLKSVQFVDAEIGRIKASLAAMQTARLTYAAALQQLLTDDDTPSTEH